MKASIVDLRYKMNDVLKALERKEEVTILYRGKIKGRLIPASGDNGARVRNHPLFGMYKDESATVDEQMNRIRSERTNVV